MIFQSLAFVVFAAVFFAGWSVVRARAPKTLAWSYLAIASLVFYGWSRWPHVFVLIAIALANYGCGRWLARRRSRGVLAIAIVAAIGPLIACKYLDFAIDQLHVLGVHVGHVGFPLPLGISFYSLSAVSYVVDVYTGETEPTANVMQHVVYLALFPLLLSGPIMRATQLLPQLADLPATTAESRWSALRQITYGLVKKCIVADHIADFTSQMFDLSTPPPSAGLWWVITFLLAIQIYCDFSGYTDIALGLGRWIGLELPDNFNHPFLATSLRDYWMRWNISFSTWLRDYIYYPLARRWPSTLGAIAAVMLTFFVSGLWHGAAWTFIVWGAFHGLALVLESWSGWNHYVAKLPGGRVLQSLVVFVTVALAMIIFRANDLTQAWAIVRTMFSFDTMQVSWLTRDRSALEEPTWLVLPVLFVIVEARHFFDFDSSRIAVAARKLKVGWIAIALLLLACVYMRGRATAFIYAGF